MAQLLKVTKSATSGVIGPVNNNKNILHNIVSSAERRNNDVVSEEENQGNRQWDKYRNCVLSQSMVDNYENFKRSDTPARLMEWSGGAWVELPEYALSQARSAFSKRLPIVEIVEESSEEGGKGKGKVSIFDFYRMLKGEDVGLQRSIAWIDVKETCFFPKFFIDESFVDEDDDDNDNNDDDDEQLGDEHSSTNNVRNPKIEIEIKLDNNNKNDIDNDRIANNYECGNVVGKRKLDGKGMCDEEDTADSSSGGDSDEGKRKRQCVIPKVIISWPNVRLMSEEERPCLTVRNYFLNGMRMVDPGVEITAIHQFVRRGAIEQARWAAFHRKMEITQGALGRKGVPNVAYAWYGTSKEGVSEVLTHGFGAPTKVPGSQAHGVGVYLSPIRLPYVSDEFAEADENGEKHLVLCRVILGNVEKVDAGSQQLYPSSDDFDSAVDNLENPKYYVVWTTNMNTHILPDCVVSYKCRAVGTEEEDWRKQWIPNGEHNGETSAKKLFLKLESLLPTDKLAQLKALCLIYKAGNVAKDLFVRKLRSIVGNEMMQSAIDALQGSN